MNTRWSCRYRLFNSFGKNGTRGIKPRIGRGVTFGSMTGSGYVSASQDKMNSTFDSVQEQTGLYAGDGGFDITVGRHTQLDGAAIASTADAGKNRLDTGSLGFSDIHNEADYKVSHSGISMSGGGDFGGDQFKGNMPGGMIVAGGSSGHAEGTTRAAVSEGTITVRDQANQQQDVADLSRDTEHANGSISPIFDKEKEQKRLQMVGQIGEIGSQAMDIARTQGELAGRAAAKDPQALDEARQQLAREGKPVTDKAVADRAYGNAMAQYGTGSPIQRGIQAATAALSGLAGGNMAGALAGAAAPELAYAIGHKSGLSEDDVAGKAIAHAILGGAVAALQGNSAAAGAAGAAASELAAKAIAGMLYPDVTDLSKLSEEQKQTVSALATISAGMAGGLAGNSTGSAVAGAGAGKNAAENNYLSRDEAAEKTSLDYKLKHGLLSGDEKAKAEARLSQLDETDKDRDAAIAAACSSGSKGSGACGALVGPAQKALSEYGENVTYSLLYKDLYPQDAKNLETVLQGLDAGSITRDQAITEIAKESGVSWETAAGRYDTAMQLQAVTAAIVGVYGIKGLGKPTTVNQEPTFNPNEIRFSQNTVSYNKTERGTGVKYTYDDLVNNMKTNGWKGDPVDVIKMPDGKMTSMDNTRISAAREAGIDVKANVRNFNDPLPKDMIASGRFGNATTWGEAITGRINNQSGGFSKNNPYGSDNNPRITGQKK